MLTQHVMNRGAWLCRLAALAVLAAGLCADKGQAADAADAPEASAAWTPRFQTVGAEAIPRAVVNAVAQDSTGFLWVATGDGLVRFDGYRFSPQTRHGVPAAEGQLGWVQALLPGRDGRLWVGSETQGLAVYDPGRDELQPLRPPSADRPLVTALAKAPDGTVWAGLMGQGLEEWPAQGQPPRLHRAGPGPGSLPDDRVLAVLVDRTGGLWVGTWQGLVRRAPGGSAFEPVVARTGGPAAGREGAGGRSLQGLAVQRLFQASDGQVWAGTRQGDVLRADPATGQAQWLPPPAGADVPGAVTAFAEPPGLEPGRVWVARSTGIHVHRTRDGQPLQALRHDPRDPSGLGANHVTSLWTDRAGWVWVGSLGGGLQRHRPQGSALEMRGGEFDPRSPLHNPSAHSVLVVPVGRTEGRRGGDAAPAGAQEEEIWIGTHDAGVAVLDSQLRLRAQVRPVLLPDVSPTGPGDGRAVPAVSAQGSASQPPPGGPSPRVEALARGPDGSVWMSAGGWLQQFDRQRRALRQLWHGAGSVQQLRVGADGTVWAATQMGLLRWRPGDAQVRRVPAQASATGEPRLVGEVYALAEAADRSLWVGSFHGLWRVPAGADHLQPVPAAADAALASQQVIGLLFDRQQRLWLDTAVAGLHRMTQWDGQVARFDAISRRLGVVGKPFGVNLLEGARGRIWTQLQVYDPARDRIDELTATDGQALGTGWFGAYAQRADGRMLFGGSRGVLQVQPVAFDPASDQPPLVVTALRINGQRQPTAGLGLATGAPVSPALPPAAPLAAPLAATPSVLTSAPVPGPGVARAQPAGLVLRPGQRNFSLEFAALEYGEPARVRYAWQMQGFDKDWTETGADLRLAAYANLAPGQYLLRARASNRSGVWGDQELAIPVQVLPAWWQHGATHALLGVGLLGLMLATLHWRTHTLRQREKTLARTVAERTQQLQTLTDALQRESAALKEASLTDPLTGLRNRRFLAEHIDADVADSQRRWQDHVLRGGAPPETADLLFFLLDIDHFKRVNDLHGHAAGDAVVRQMRGRLQRVFRDSDHLVRWGGEEFLIVARGSNRLHAADLAERARLAVSGAAFAMPEGDPLHCTCSLGFACFPLSTRDPAAVGWSTVVGLADAALYRAKANGRDAWAGVLQAQDPAQDQAQAEAEASLRQPRSGAQWLAEGGLVQQCSWEPVDGGLKPAEPALSGPGALPPAMGPAEDGRPRPG